MALLDDQEIEACLAGVEGWNREDEKIVKEFKRGDFVGAVAFVGALVQPAEEMGHHPDIAISWETVEVSITSHSEGGLTAADFELAGRIDDLS